MDRGELRSRQSGRHVEGSAWLPFLRPFAYAGELDRPSGT